MFCNVGDIKTTYTRAITPTSVHLIKAMYVLSVRRAISGRVATALVSSTDAKVMLNFLYAPLHDLAFCSD